MSEAGTVIAIHLAEVESGPVHAVDSAEAVAGAGLRGDRYFEPGAKPAEQLTLIESEELEGSRRTRASSSRRASPAGSSRRAACG